MPFKSEKSCHLVSRESFSIFSHSLGKCSNPKPLRNASRHAVARIIEIALSWYISSSLTISSLSVLRLEISASAFLVCWTQLRKNIVSAKNFVWILLSITVNFSKRESNGGISSVVLDFELLALRDLWICSSLAKIGERILSNHW